MYLLLGISVIYLQLQTPSWLVFNVYYHNQKTLKVANKKILSYQ
jgi:hypothetical protein